MGFQNIQLEQHDKNLYLRLIADERDPNYFQVSRPLERRVFFTLRPGLPAEILIALPNREFLRLSLISEHLPTHITEQDVAKWEWVAADGSLRPGRRGALLRSETDRAALLASIEAGTRTIITEQEFFRMFAMPLGEQRFMQEVKCGPKVFTDAGSGLRYIYSYDFLVWFDMIAELRASETAGGRP